MGGRQRVQRVVFNSTNYIVLKEPIAGQATVGYRQVYNAQKMEIYLSKHSLSDDQFINPFIHNVKKCPSIRCEHRKILKECLAIFQHYEGKG